MKKWIKENRIEFILVLLILLVAAFLRFYRLPEYMNFLGDEGRDALIVKKILILHDFPLIGPTTSIGNMYLGPLYYYMMALPMAVFWMNPAAAAGGAALVGVLTVALIYYLARIWFGRLPAFISAILYSVSPVTIIYSRSSWNPNPAPFFALLAIFGLYKARFGDFRWFILTGACLAAAAQMHYLALILIPVFGVLWIWELQQNIKSSKIKHFTFGTVGAILAFLLLMSPLLVFDLKHDFMNFHAISKFFSNRETTVNINPFNTLERVPTIYGNDLIGRYMAGENFVLTVILGILILVPIILAIFWLMQKRKLDWNLLALGIWLFFGVMGLALYKQHIYDHYLGFLNPVPYLLFGSLLLMKNKWIKFGLLGLSAILVVVNLQKSPLQNPPNNQLERTQAVTRFVITEAGEKPFNFALLAKNNYDSAYRFYMDQYGRNPLDVPKDITDQLFVVCEDPVCTPINSPKYEIAAFGWSKIDKEIDIMGVKVFKLVHNPTGQP